MKTKLEMAHEWAMKHGDAETVGSRQNMIKYAWDYADAMQAEANKREKEDAAQRRKEIREMLNAPNTFVEREGQHFDDVANQKRTPKVSRFERSDAVKEVLSRAENMGLIKPKAIEEWQPDWSQAPDWANWWAMDGDKKTRWIYSELEQPYTSDTYLRWFAVGRFDSADAPSFGYTGNWRNSLRERPE